MRFEKKDIISWSNSDEARQYVGKRGFIGNSLGEIRESLRRVSVVILKDVEEDDVDCFFFDMGIFEDCHAGLFLPLDRVKIGD